jgi:pSer/pThr/pTyr-binding forkhead associated (FHA) protein
MGRHLQELFTASCGLFGPWGLRISSSSADVIEHQIQTPYAFAGSRVDLAIHWSHPQVSRRHAYFQVLPGGVFCIDLGSRTGVHWEDATQYEGWIRPDQKVRIGPFALQLFLANPNGWLNEPGLPVGNPLADRVSESSPLSTQFVVEVSDGAAVLAKGRMNRIMALVGKSPRCLFHIKDPSLSDFHCSLVRTPVGLWIVDLQSQRGTFLDGRPINIARVQEGTLVQVGNYTLRFLQQRSNTVVNVVANVGRCAISQTGDPGVESEATANSKVEATIPLGSSADMNVSPSPVTGPETAAVEPPRATEARSSAVAATSRRTMLAALDDRVSPEWTMLVALVNQFNSMQAQMFDQFQEGILKTSQLFTSLHHDQMFLVRQELDELRNVTHELRHLQGELTGRLVAGAPASATFSPGGDAASTAAGTPGTLPPATVHRDPFNKHANARSMHGESNSSANPTLLENGAATRTAQPPGSPEDIHLWLNQRIASLQEQRQSRWDKLLGLLRGK